MNGFLLLLLVGLTVCGVLLYRHSRRPSTSVAPVMPAGAHADDLAPVEAWQRKIQLTPSPGYPANAAMPDRLREKLLREEAKQRPQEARN